MVDRQLDLDLLAFAADLQLDAACAGDAAAIGNRAGDAATASVKKIDVVRPEKKQRRPGWDAVRRQTDRTIGDPHLAVLDIDRQRGGIADEPIDESRVRPVIDVVGGADLLD